MPDTDPDSGARRFFTWVTARPRIVLWVSVASIVVLASGMTQLRRDTSSRALMPPRHPVVELRDEVKEEFRLGDAVLVAVVADGRHGVFTPRGLALIDDLSHALGEIPGVDPQGVRSLATETDIVGTASELRVEPFFEDPPARQAAADRVRTRVMDMPPYLGRLVARDGSAALIALELLDPSEGEAVYEAVRGVVDPLDVPGHEIHVAGQAAADALIGRYIDKDAQRLNPLAGLMIAIVLYLAYRAWRGVGLPGLVAVGSVAASLGTMGAAGVPFYLVTSGLSVILIGIAVCDGIHILGQYYQELRSTPAAPPREVVVRAMLQMWRPIAVTSVTTMGGFVALSAASSLPPLRYFGLFAAVGVAAAFLLSVLTLPAVLCLLKARLSPAFDRDPEVREHDAFARTAAGMGRWVVAHPRWMLAAWAVVIAVAVLGATRLRMEDASISYYAYGEPLRQADRVINERFDGTNTMDVVVRADRAEAFYEPANLRALDALQAHLETLPHVKGTTSIAEHVKLMHRAMHGNDPAYYAIPQDPNLVAQYFLLYFSSSDSGALENEVDHRFQTANVRVQLDRGYWSDIRAVVEGGRAYLRRELDDPELHGELAGSLTVGYALWSILREEHPTGVGLAFFVVWAITALSFRSPVAGLLAMLPVALAVLVIYGVMGFGGIWLRVGTSMSAAIAVGLAVDSSIHVLDRLIARVRDEGGTLEDALPVVFPSTGRALLFNVLAIALGFGVLITSAVESLMEFGVLVVVCVSTSFLGSMTLLPALVAVFRPAFLFRRVSWVPKEVRAGSQGTG